MHQLDVQASGANGPRGSPTPDLAAVARAFVLPGRFRLGAPYGSGHINDTFVVVTEQAGKPIRYILQRINHRIFRDVPALMENIGRVTRHVAPREDDAGAGAEPRRELEVIPAGDGRPYHRDAAGGWWRCFPFIENARTSDIVETPRQAAEAARAFGEFQRRLVDLPGGRLHDTIPDFHHTRKRFAALRRAIEADGCHRRPGAEREIAFALEREPMVDRLLDLQARGKIPERITHNDTKFNNVMLDEATQKAVCVIDLDTVMPGLVLHDFGDMVRSATNSAAEDEPDPAKVEMRLPIFEALVDGYLAAAGGFLNEAECRHLAFSGRLMTYEVGIRFLADHLEGDTYFKTHRPGHNLDRARNQFALLHRMEHHAIAMEMIVQRRLDP